MRLVEVISVGAGTRTLMKHVHGWQLSHHRNDNEHPDAKGKDGIVRYHISFHFHQDAVLMYIVCSFTVCAMS